ncbi:protein-export chaperone SecB [Telmatospirillum sp. J64-1]|uniref:protein-export chaperone SecB n=1 Tax=Telmatospirillum sp. J64-1 TaxID=2502183 RepID=UPI00115E820C|nr:protein-export chaperone SecB [Telmatospirillum sp. J64-1]
MTEQNPNQNAQGQAEGPTLSVNGQYIKDLSFEVPHAPGIFGELARNQPEIPINIDIRANTLQDNVYEVTLHLKVDAKLAEKSAFIVELAFAGIFTVNVPQEHLQPMLLIECPRLLFPFARNIIADVTRDGGFPPLMLQPIDFVALYRQRIGQMQQGNGNGQTAQA